MVGTGAGGSPSGRTAVFGAAAVRVSSRARGRGPPLMEGSGRGGASTAETSWHKSLAVYTAAAAAVAAVGYASWRSGIARRGVLWAYSVARPGPPKPRQRVTILKKWGDVREDPYYWMRDDDRTDKEVLRHIGAENWYTSVALAGTDGLQRRLYLEARARIQEEDESVPVRRGGWWYYSRTEKGKQYKVHCRRPAGPGSAGEAELELDDVMDRGAPEEVLLDENVQARGHSYFRVGGMEVSHDHALLAYAVDTTGDEKYVLRVRDISAKRELQAEVISDLSGGLAWSADGALYYVTKDAKDRPFRLHRHILGRPAIENELLYEEIDEQFYLDIELSDSEQLLILSSGSAITSEQLVAPAAPVGPDAPGTFRSVAKRTVDVEYSLAHCGNALYVIFRAADCMDGELRVAAAPKGDAALLVPSDRSTMPILLPHSPGQRLEGVVAKAGYVVVFSRRDGLQMATAYPAAAASSPGSFASAGLPLDFSDLGEEAYSISAGLSGFASNLLRVSFDSLKTPRTVYDIDLRTLRRVSRKVQPVPGYDASLYETKRVWAASHDGVRVPISLVYNREKVGLVGADPLLLDAYGAYEICNDPYFSSSVVSLLDRGFVYAQAHVRGGGEMGRPWYEDGKMLHKRNTFLDVIACAKHLIQEGYGAAGLLCLEGRSAGGLTVGATLNLEPDLFAAAIAAVPFVDALTTMQDPSIPLTEVEWDEWGDPGHRKDHYEYMKTYSPMDNVRKGENYPAMLITGGLHDPRVGYWEPLKYTAVLRDRVRRPERILCKIDTGAGHFSKSGRFERLHEYALEQAFLLKSVGLA